MFLGTAYTQDPYDSINVSISKRNLFSDIIALSSDLLRLRLLQLPWSQLEAPPKDSQVLGYAETCHSQTFTELLNCLL